MTPEGETSFPYGAGKIPNTFRTLEFRIWNLFRISCFVLRISFCEAKGYVASAGGFLPEPTVFLTFPLTVLVFVLVLCPLTGSPFI